MNMDVLHVMFIAYEMRKRKEKSGLREATLK